MNTGQMRDRIKIFNKKKPTPPFVDMTDSDGELIANVAAKKEDRLSPSIWGAMAENAVNSKQFVIRYKKDIFAGMILKHGNDSYDIKAVAELGNNRQWTIILAERVDNIGI